MTTELSEYYLSEEKQKNLTAGTSISEDSENTSDELSELSEDLLQTKDASKQEEAWIIAIVPPEKYVDGTHKHNAKPHKISVQFLLQNEHTFWKHYEYPEKHFDESHPFYQLISETGYGIGNVKHALGEPVPVRYDKITESWSIDIKNEAVPDQSTERIEYKTGAELIKKFGTYVVPLFVSIVTILFIIASRGALLIPFVVILIAVLYYYSQL